MPPPRDTPRRRGEKGSWPGTVMLPFPRDDDALPSLHASVEEAVARLHEILGKYPSEHRTQV